MTLSERRIGERRFNRFIEWRIRCRVPRGRVDRNHVGVPPTIIDGLKVQSLITALKGGENA